MEMIEAMRCEQDILVNKIAEEREQKVNKWWQKKKRENTIRNNQNQKIEPTVETLDPAVIESNYRAWLTNKLRLQESEKLQVIRQTKKEKENQERLRRKSEKKHEEWLKSARYKPKPVPLNQGFLSTENETK